MQVKICEKTDFANAQKILQVTYVTGSSDEHLSIDEIMQKLFP